MNKILLVTVFVLYTFNNLFGQNLIAVHHIGKPYFTQNIDSALKNSLDGDTIYLPGGNFVGNINISKSIYLIGVGFNDDSSKATYATKIFGNVLIKKGVGFASVNGLSLKDYVIGIGDSTNNILIKNCYSGGITLGNYCANISILNNISLGGISSNYSNKNIYISNNIVKGALSAFKYSYFANNVFLQILNNGQQILIDCDNNEFKNNIFLPDLVNYVSNSYENEYNIFKNNLYGTYYGNPYSSSNTNSLFNNYTGQNDTITFTSGYISFSLSGNYHLKGTSPGKNGGSDGTDVGIYGGAFPWQDGNIPFNPHIQTRYVAPVTKSDGKLPVKIKVKSQNN